MWDGEPVRAARYPSRRAVVLILAFYVGSDALAQMRVGVCKHVGQRAACCNSCLAQLRQCSIGRRECPGLGICTYLAAGLFVSLLRHPRRI